MKPTRRTAAETVLRRALWASFETLATERAGTLPTLPVVRSQSVTLERAWRACGAAAGRVYVETQAAWWQTTGHCALGGEARPPCVCAPAEDEVLI